MRQQAFKGTVKQDIEDENFSHRVLMLQRINNPSSKPDGHYAGLVQKWLELFQVDQWFESKCKLAENISSSEYDINSSPGACI